MLELSAEQLKFITDSPFKPGSLVPQANRLQECYERLQRIAPEPNTKQRLIYISYLNEWLDYPVNQRKVTEFITNTVSLVSGRERVVFSESHDLFHSAEMVTSLLDDKSRGVGTDNATVLLAAAFALTHDLGRRIEKSVTRSQIDLYTNLHHDVLSLKSALRLLRLLSLDSTLDDRVKTAFGNLLLSSLIHAQNIGFEPPLAISADTDRRQLLGSLTVGRDILYFGGMQGKDLSPGFILGFPPGYTHYDSGGFFGQQDWAKGYVYRDPSIRELRELDFVYDKLAAEAMTILLLACGGDERLSNSLRVIPELPVGRITDSQGRPWMPRKALPEDISRNAREQALEVEERIPDQALSVGQTQNLFGKFVHSYGTIIDKGHLEKVLGNVGQFSLEDRVKWARILYFAHHQNLQRYALRRSVLDEEQSKGTFLGKITEPFVEILESRRPHQEKVTEIYQTIASA